MEPVEATALAVHYQLVSRFTSCVVVLERAAGEKADGHPALRAVPQMLAAGWGGSGLLDYTSLDRPAISRTQRLSVSPLRPTAPPEFLKRAVDYSRTPHVCFKAELASAPLSGDGLARILEAGLHARFGPIRIKKRWYMGQWIAGLRVGEAAFSVHLGRSKDKDDEWVLLAGPLDRDRGQRSRNFASELALICREIHAALTAVPGISDVRWYFEGFQSQRHAVATPDALPWSKS
jgi:hypothetical protein